MKLKTKLFFGTTVLTMLAYGSLNINYSSFDMHKESKSIPILEDKNIVLKAERMIGQPYFSKDFPENPSCIDVYVRAAELKYNIIAHAQNNPEKYSTFNERSNTVKKNIEYLLNVIGLQDFNNFPNHKMFTRRIQNVISYQIAHNQFKSKINGQVELGWLIYFSDGKKQIPTHVGIVSKIDEEKKPIEVIHASFSKKKVVRDPLERLTESGLKITGYGSPPIIKKNWTILQ